MREYDFCEECGIKYTVLNEVQKYCSRKCSVRVYERNRRKSLKRREYVSLKYKEFLSKNPDYQRNYHRLKIN